MMSGAASSYGQQTVAHFTGSVAVSGAMSEGKDLLLGTGDKMSLGYQLMDAGEAGEYGEYLSLLASGEEHRILISGASGVEFLADPAEGVGVFGADFKVYEDSHGEKLSVMVDSQLSGNIYTSGSLGIRVPDAMPNGTLLALNVHYTGAAEASGSRPENLGDNTGGGQVVYFGSASAELSTGALYFLNSDGGWQSANSAQLGSGSSQLLGISLGSKPGHTGMLLNGFYHMKSYMSGAFTCGGPVYIHSSSKDRTHTEGGYITGGLGLVTGSGNIVRTIGYGISSSVADTSIIYFNPDATYVEIS